MTCLRADGPEGPGNLRETRAHLKGWQPEVMGGTRGGLAVSQATIAHLTETSFDEAVVEHAALVVDFWAPWCGPCRAIAPTLEALGEEYAGRVAIAKVNVDEQPTLAARYQVRSIPTILFLKDGRVVDQVVGAVPRAQLTRRMDALL